ncbi:MAG: SixA phosphatase family protein [Gaiellales bacterium]
MITPMLLVRHGNAGSREAWAGDDRLRPLDGGGRRQAAWLAGELAQARPPRLLSSPYVRCVQSLEPLARELGLAIEEHSELAEGSAGSALDDFVARIARETPGSVLCTHGDVIGELIGEGLPCAKGSVWAIELREGSLEPTRYLKPTPV